MFNHSEMKRAVALLKNGYSLLRWVAESVKGEGTLDFRAVHQFATLPAAAEAWVRSNYSVIPANIRPKKEELTAFSF